MKEKIIILTGASRGLGGQMLLQLLKKSKMKVICLSRGKNDLYEHDSVSFYQTDLSRASDFSFLSDLLTPYEEITFINNAGVVEPIGAIGNLDSDAVEIAMHTNVTAPILIINEILKGGEGKKITIANISSGAAKRVIPGWSVYSAGKASMLFFLEHLEKQDNIKVMNIDPGVLNTDMQAAIRSVDESAFPDVRKFRDLESEGKLKDPADVAQEIINMLNIQE